MGTSSTIRYVRVHRSKQAYPVRSRYIKKMGGQHAIAIATEGCEHLTMSGNAPQISIIGQGKHGRVKLTKRRVAVLGKSSHITTNLRGGSAAPRVARQLPKAIEKPWKLPVAQTEGFLLWHGGWIAVTCNTECSACGGQHELRRGIYSSALLPRDRTEPEHCDIRGLEDNKRPSDGARDSIYLPELGKI